MYKGDTMTARESIEYLQQMMNEATIGQEHIVLEHVPLPEDIHKTEPVLM